MGRTVLRAIVRRLVGIGRGLNPAAALTLGLLVFEAGFYFFALVPASQERVKLEAQVLAQHRSSSRGHASTPVNLDPRVDLAKFYAALPASSNAPDLLRRLHVKAKDQGLTLQAVEYRPIRDPEGKLLRYQILLPAKGTYPEIRRFLAQVSAELPGLAIDSVNFQRQHVGVAVLEAQIKLTLFMSMPS